MTAVNCYFRPEVAYVVSDTLHWSTGPEGRSLGEGLKVIALPAQCCIVAARGASILTWAFAMLIQTPDAEDFDAIVGRIECFATETLAWSKQVHPAAPFDKLELILVGWSAQSKRMAGFSCLNEGAGWVYRAVNEDFFASPGIDPRGWPGLAAAQRRGGKLRVPQDLIGYCEYQASVANKEPGPYKIGGRIQLTTLKKHSIETRFIHTYRDQPG